MIVGDRRSSTVVILERGLSRGAGRFSCMTPDGPDTVAASFVERSPVPVIFLRTVDEVEVFAPLWTTFENRVGLRGRRFFGAFFEAAHEYWICVQRRDGDDPLALDLETGDLPGGWYLRARVAGEPPELYGRIAPTFAELARRAEVDPTRPGIEFYRQRDAIECLLPVVVPAAPR
jgi:hypothetical protein